MSNAPHTSVRREVEIQRRYYSDTAARYEIMHAQEGATDAFSQAFIHSILRLCKVQSVLDVGAATGCGIRDFRKAFPGVFVCGVEPVSALLQQGRKAGNLSDVSFLQASGDALPFPDSSFDAVCESATLHHVPNPSALVSEMLRVARKIVVIADSNRFGQGSWAARLLKLFLYKVGLWRAFDFLRTRGKHYQVSEGDGLFYSYSVYDSYALAARWADRILIVSGDSGHSRSWLHPLLTAKGVILVAIRESRQGE